MPSLDEIDNLESLNINNIDLNSYFNSENYTQSDLTINNNKYITNFIIIKIKNLLSQNNINFELIESVISNILADKFNFNLFFSCTNSAPFYTYKVTTETLSFMIEINDNCINKNILIKIFHELTENTETCTNEETSANTETCNNEETNANTETCTNEENSANTETCVSNTSNNNNSNIDCNNIDNDIIFTKSVSPNTNIFDKLLTKNKWKLVTCYNNLDINLNIPAYNKIIIQITAGLKINNLKKTTYRWGLFNTTTNSIDSTSIIYDNIYNNNKSINKIVKSGFFHISHKTTDSIVNYKWIHINDKSDDNIQIDFNYPVTIIAWKLQNNINNINITYLEHITQKINELQESYYNLSNRIDSLQ